MSQYMVPNWNLKHQRQEQVEGGEQGNRSSHVHNHNPSDLLPMRNYEVAELTWENGQLAMHGLGGLIPAAPTKPTWGRAGDTLESIVHQATCHKQNPSIAPRHDQNPAKIMSSTGRGSAGKWAETPSHVHLAPRLMKKRMRSETEKSRIKFSIEECVDGSACGSASATFCKDNDTTMMTWASLESPRSLRTKTVDEDSACHGGSENRDQEQETKGEAGHSHSKRPSRAAAIHNQSERRRRDRINQKMKALQKLVPNSSKTDKASMLDEVIEYLKQLQAQVQLMSSTTKNIPPQMVMPLGMQQQIQMFLLARMGMGVGLGMGMGMLDMSGIPRPSAPHALSPLLQPAALAAAAAAAAPTFLPPPFVIPTRAQPLPTTDAAPSNNSVPLNDPYCTFLAQSMNMELYNKMAALYRQQLNQTAQATSSSSPSSQVQGG